MERTRTVEVASGRILAYDDAGDPDGVPVVYLHGTPDSRLARHPDDELAARAGVRLIAVDRPGFGGTTPDDRRHQLGDDLAFLLDDLGLSDVALFGWSSGGLAALAAAWSLRGRCRRMVLVAALPPVEAYLDPVVLAALGPQRRGLVDMATDIDPADLAAEVAPFLVPLPITVDLAREHIVEGAGVVGRAELESVPGAVDQMASALVLGVAPGLGGIETDLQQQFQPGLPLHEIGVPVHLVHGELDSTSPPEVGRWLVDRLPDATLEVVPGAGHHLLFPRWEILMRSFVGDIPG